MHVTVSTRHVPIDGSLRDRAEEILHRLGRLGDRALEGTVVFDVVGGTPWVELRLHCPGGKVLVGTAESGDHRSALDRVELKVRRQLRRVVTRPLAQRHAPVST
jgi:ribosomal subunit interface protein